MSKFSKTAMLALRKVGEGVVHASNFGGLQPFSYSYEEAPGYSRLFNRKTMEKLIRDGYIGAGMTGKVWLTDKGKAAIV